MSDFLEGNYFIAEAAIVARVKETFAAEALEVYTPATIPDALESSQPDIGLFVVYQGDRMPNDPHAVVGQGEGRKIVQQWLVILSVRHAGGQLQDSKDIRLAAGPLISRLLVALQGWKPVTNMRPLVRVNGPSAGYSSSFGYFPFLFEGIVLT